MSDAEHNPGDPSERVEVLVWCHVCNAESYGIATGATWHDPRSYELDAPWRVVTVHGYRVPLTYTVCSDACEAQLLYHTPEKP